MIVDFAGAHLDKGCSNADDPNKGVARNNPNLRGSRYNILLHSTPDNEEPEMITTWVLNDGFRPLR